MPVASLAARGPSSRVAATTAATLAAVAGTWLAGCKAEEQPGVFLQFRAEDSRHAPDAIKFTWMVAGSELITSRLPEQGAFPTRGPIMGSLFIETSGPLTEPRLIAARGVRGLNDEQVVSGRALVIPASVDKVQSYQVLLGDPLLDQDGNGKPDVVENDCLSHDPESCDVTRPPPPPPERGPADAGVDGPDPEASPPDAGTDGAVEGPPVGEPTLESELIGHWRLDDGMGTTARDSSGKGLSGMLRGLSPTNAWVPGKFNGALEIPSANGNCVHVPQSPNLESVKQAFTIAAWTYRTSARGSWATVLSRRYLSSGNEHYTLAFQGGILRGLVNTYLGAGTAGNVSGRDSAPLNSWVHVALTYDGACCACTRTARPPERPPTRRRSCPTRRRCRSAAGRTRPPTPPPTRR